MAEPGEAGRGTALLRPIPNILTCTRLVMTPVVAWHLGHQHFAAGAWWLAAAGITDFADGQVARRLHLETPLGQRLDPIADKLLLVSVYLALAWGEVFPWWLVGIVMGRDVLLLMAAGWAILFTRIREFRPRWWGKVSTTIQMVGALVAILGRLEPFYFLRPLTLVAVWAVAAVTLWSGIDYALHSARLLRRERKSFVDGGSPRG